MGPPKKLIFSILPLGIAGTAAVPIFLLSQFTKVHQGRSDQRARPDPGCPRGGRYGHDPAVKQPPRSYPGRLFSYLFSFSNTVFRLRLVIFPFLSYDMDNLNLQPRGDLCTLTPGINGLRFFICTVSLAGSLNPPTFP